ncbi:MAG: RIP metalloprotease RseP [Deltaproteobacteria bacterium]|jgi:regulator of sigma E protease|nr:RIP metalloprotease RseP [Deltaproteobacteria bacterium]MCL6120609.1 RIP metalloprotease RseP [Deltaproteobacteria bacterium]
MFESITYDILAFLIVISIIVLIHEFGHFIVAKKLGVKVEKFSLGFGPKVFGRQIGETEYLISALPLGGYVKLTGEDPSEELPPEDKERSYSSLSPYKKFLIIFCGPFFNFLLAALIFTIIFMSGRPVLKPVIGGLMKGKPAVKAGLKKGEIITSVNGIKVHSWAGLAENIEKYGKKTLKLGVEEKIGNKIIRSFVSVKPQLISGFNIYKQKINRYIIGITPSNSKNAVFYRYDGFFDSFYSALKEIWFIIYITIVSLFYLIIGKLPASDLGGPIMIAQLSGRAAGLGVSDFFYFVAFISVNIGLVNLFPIPALDGGHLLFSIIEMVKRSPLSVKFQETAVKIGFAFLILLLLFVSYNDILRAIKT